MPMPKLEIPDEAVEAAAKAIYHPQPLYDEATEEFTGHRPWEWLTSEHQDSLRRDARAALDAAAPYMLSHERQQTADAHRDAMVNRDTVDRLERELENAKAEAWDRCASSIVDEHGNRLIPYENTNPYRRQA